MIIVIVQINAVILVLTVATIVRGRKHGGAEHNLKIYDLVK